MLHEGSKPELWNQKRRPLQGNSSVNTLPRHPDHVTATTDSHATIGKLLSEAMFSVWSAPMLYMEAS
jgi:hypothetical protein